MRWRFGFSTERSQEQLRTLSYSTAERFGSTQIGPKLSIGCRFGRQSGVFPCYCRSVFLVRLRPQLCADKTLVNNIIHAEERTKTSMARRGPSARFNQLERVRLNRCCCPTYATSLNSPESSGRANSCRGSPPPPAHGILRSYSVSHAGRGSDRPSRWHRRPRGREPWCRSASHPSD